MHFYAGVWIVALHYRIGITQVLRKTMSAMESILPRDKFFSLRTRLKEEFYRSVDHGPSSNFHCHPYAVVSQPSVRKNKRDKGLGQRSHRNYVWLAAHRKFA